MSDSYILSDLECIAEVLCENDLKIECRDRGQFIRTNEPHHEKTYLWGFSPGPTQTELRMHPQKMARGLKVWIENVERSCYLCS